MSTERITDEVLEGVKWLANILEAELKERGVVK